ncbi:MAG: squalene/phytoene synthase family protein [Phycisphaerales bacterium JB040]
MPEVVSVDELLRGSSRTFALSIPLLPEPVRSELGVAYLLFRLADTVEDEDAWSDGERLAGLRLMREALSDAGSVLGAGGDGSGEGVSGWLPAVSGTLEHEGYARLFREAGFVARAYSELAPGARSVIASHLVRTLDGMIAFVERGRRTRDLGELLEYCYSVAGIVGELCTALFVRQCPELGAVSDRLGTLGVRYGEGLQLVNILRDAADDRAARRGFVPEGVTQADLLPIACRDLGEADRYVELLRSSGASGGVVAFNLLNVRLAHETLGLVERGGAGVKLSRARVGEIVAGVARETGVRAEGIGATGP